MGTIAALFLAERERWILWLPVAVASGVALYFASPAEPPLWPGPLIFALSVLAAIFLRRFELAWVVAIGVAAAALGFTATVERARNVAAPILAGPTGAIRLEGRIVDIQPLEQGERLVLDRVYVPDIAAQDRPARVRVRLATPTTDFEPGQWVAMRALLFPPPPPVAPGAYDFPRQAWFLRLGGVGSVLGKPFPLESPDDATFLDRMRLKLATVRHRLTARINASMEQGGIGSGVGPIAAALITAERGPVPPETLQSYRDAGLAHILVIAGMHMSMVAGLVFFALRGALAAIPYIALRYPIKKWTAAVALLVTLAYLLISGAPVPTQRAFVMNSIILIAILADREAISLRSVAWAALVVLMTQPEALAGPSFQLSFAAVVALVSAYESLAPKIFAWEGARNSWGGRIALYIGGIVFTTLVASSATAYFTIYHFDRYSNYAVLGNLVAVPIVGFWVMPAALLAICALPFGLDPFFWHVMGWGIVAVSKVALWVSGLPGATANLPAMPSASAAVFGLGGLWLCLWRGRWRLLGFAGFAVAVMIYALHRPPDLLIDGGGRLAALRGADGAISFVGAGGSQTLRDSWAKLTGLGPHAPVTRPGAAGENCEDQLCLWRSGDHVVALVLGNGAPASDCRGADIVLSAPSEWPCATAIFRIDRDALRRDGARALWLSGDQIEVESVTQKQGDRPWHTRPSRNPPRRERRTAVPPVSNGNATDRPDNPEP